MERFSRQNKPERGILTKIVSIFDLKILKYCFRNINISFICYMISSVLSGKHFQSFNQTVSVRLEFLFPWLKYFNYVSGQDKIFLAVSKQKENVVKIGKVITKGQSHAAKYFLKF